ncbi:replication factor C subunit 1 [Melitaea cinxia]|uniref:replication factor C subunit 1 n=1 Tax=Melitaea cinxia TaxID=113334 RepID=UPI001E26F03F|nr:replication factor C subunit 1 [Melitaea cinxia]
MSRDIRSFFTVKKEKKAKDEDSDVIPESPNVQIIQKKKPNRKRRQIKDDSDEEIFTSKKKIQSPPKAKLKEVKPTELFGSAPIKRTEPLVKKSKKKTEIAIHSDEEFEQSLLQIDEINCIENEKKTPEKNQVNNIKKNGTKSTQNHDSINNKISKPSPKKSPKPSSKRKLDTSIDVKKEIETIPKQIEKSCADFSEFVNDEEHDDNDQSSVPKSKKFKMDKSLNESVLSDEERHERKRYSAALYQKYLNRSGPKHLGSKEIPEGAPNCLKDYAFLLTGVLDSFERDEIVAAITKYGGCVKSGISKKVTHVLAGEDAGPAKLAKAQELGIKIISEDEFLSVIKDSTNKKHSPRDKKPSHNENKRSDKKSNENKNESSTKRNKKSPKSEEKNKITVNKIKKESLSPKKNVSKEIVKSDERKVKSEDTKSKSEIIEKSVQSGNKLNGEFSKSSSSIDASNALMWVDKYKPQNLKQIIGQHGEASNVKKLLNWLTKWYANRKAKLPKPNPWAKNDDGGYYKAALLSGPPGVGKTTTVSLVCKELGFDMVEFNASDTRSKNLIKDQISDLLTTTSLSGYAKGNSGKGAVTKKHVLVMDEVDGMAGNEDRGGLQELISLIKSTSVPIICMCNDRNSEKMRTLVNYCYDLRFTRPRLEQIKAAMMSICFKEGLKLPGDALSQLITASGNDVRQTLHRLALCAASPHVCSDASSVRKDVKTSPWEAIRKVFSSEEHKGMSLNDKSDLFFSDYSLAPLFVQENYLNVAPHCPKQEILERISKAAESISIGDIIDAKIRGQQAWSLLPLQAMYSSVIPGNILEGHVAGQIQFPSWLGKNSRKNKMHRLCQEIHAHTRLSTSGSKSSIYLDYAYHLRDAVVNPLIKDKADGIEKSLDVLESYHLLREDLDSLVELSLWPGQRNPTILIDSKVKAAMTRTYNKKATALPYAPATVKKGSKVAQEDTEYSQEDEEQASEDSDPENDALIKKKKNKETEKPSSSKTSKGKQNEASSPTKGKGKKTAPKGGKKK